jgi:integration host factor subunit beta
VTKQELIDAVGQHYPQLAGHIAEMVVNALFTGMTDALAKGERIEIRGFGSFFLTTRAARAGRNPRTGAAIAVTAKKVPRFRAGKTLRARIDGQPEVVEDNEEEGA